MNKHMISPKMAKAAWSPAARKKRLATHAARRAAKAGTALVPVGEFPIEAIPARKQYAKRTPKLDERVRLAGNLIEVVRLIIGGAK